jgi:UDPglucose--hexose-1-phosphate uridylyltransferase
LQTANILLFNYSMDFKFIQNQISGKWVISSPRRAIRPDGPSGGMKICPFCSGNESLEKESYRIGGENSDSSWKVRVIPNKFPFATIHEVIIHSQDHHKNFDELPLEQNYLILKTYKERFEYFKDKGRVCIFHNFGEAAGASQPHPHSQLVVLPDFVKLDVPPIDLSEGLDTHETEHFVIFAPLSSDWPDEIWIKPRRNMEYFGSISDEELKDLARLLYRLIQIFDLRHGHEFPYNFYISPYKEWYLRIIPRAKSAGGFELGTNVWVNTQDPKETIAFIKEHFESPSEEKIRHEHQAEYHKAV